MYHCIFEIEIKVIGYRQNSAQKNVKNLHLLLDFGAAKEMLIFKLTRWQYKKDILFKLCEEMQTILSRTLERRSPSFEEG